MTQPFRPYDPATTRPSEWVQLTEIRRMLATTGVDRPAGDTATWLWAVLDAAARSDVPATCPACVVIATATERK